MAKKKVRRKAEIPVDESNEDRFIRVVTPRVNKAVKAIEVIGFCTGSTYEYTANQSRQIVKALTDSIANLSDKFAGKTSTGGSFNLKD